MTAPSGTPGISEQYLAAAGSFIEFARTLSDEDWGTTVPCTPEWTVRDVLSHVSGIPDDALAGRLDGVATDPWTAAQVERNRPFSVSDLLTRWEEQMEPFAGAIESMDQRRPPIDCHTHEHDVRHALGRPGGREHQVIDAMVANASETLADVPASLVIDFVDGPTVAAGAGGPEVSLTIDPFEYFRSRLGRRSRPQLEAYDWSGDRRAVAATQDSWWVFGVAEEDIIE